VIGGWNRTKNKQAFDALLLNFYYRNTRWIIPKSEAIFDLAKIKSSQNDAKSKK